MSTLTQVWDAQKRNALIQLDGKPAGRLELGPPWRVHPDGDQPFEIDAEPDEPSLALLKAFIALDERARGVAPDASTRKPPKYADQNMAAWLYTQAKVRRQSGRDYDDWGTGQFMAAGRIFKNVVGKYGDDVPDPEFA